MAFGTPVRSVSYRNARLQNEIQVEAAGEKSVATRQARTASFFARA